MNSLFMLKMGSTMECWSSLEKKCINIELGWLWPSIYFNSLVVLNMGTFTLSSKETQNGTFALFTPFFLLLFAWWRSRYVAFRWSVTADIYRNGTLLLLTRGRRYRWNTRWSTIYLTRNVAIGCCSSCYCLNKLC